MNRYGIAHTCGTRRRTAKAKREDTRSEAVKKMKYCLNTHDFIFIQISKNANAGHQNIICYYMFITSIIC